jgi:hypothetical protein
MQVYLRGMSIAHGQECSSDLNWIIHGGANANALVVQVPPCHHGRNRIDKIMTGRSQSHASNVVIDWNLGREDIIVVYNVLSFGPAMISNSRRRSRYDNCKDLDEK